MRSAARQSAAEAPPRTGREKPASARPSVNTIAQLGRLGRQSSSVKGRQAPGPGVRTVASQAASAPAVPAPVAGPERQPKVIRAIYSDARNRWHRQGGLQACVDEAEVPEKRAKNILQSTIAAVCVSASKIVRTNKAIDMFRQLRADALAQQEVERIQADLQSGKPWDAYEDEIIVVIKSLFPDDNEARQALLASFEQTSRSFSDMNAKLELLRSKTLESQKSLAQMADQMNSDREKVRRTLASLPDISAFKGDRPSTAKANVDAVDIDAAASMDILRGQLTELRGNFRAMLSAKKAAAAMIRTQKKRVSAIDPDEREIDADLAQGLEDILCNFTLSNFGSAERGSGTRIVSENLCSEPSPIGASSDIRISPVELLADCSKLDTSPRARLSNHVEHHDFTLDSWSFGSEPSHIDASPESMQEPEMEPDDELAREQLDVPFDMLLDAPLADRDADAEMVPELLHAKRCSAQALQSVKMKLAFLRSSVIAGTIAEYRPRPSQPQTVVEVVPSKKDISKLEPIRPVTTSWCRVSAVNESSTSSSAALSIDLVKLKEHHCQPYEEFKRRVLEADSDGSGVEKVLKDRQRRRFLLRSVDDPPFPPVPWAAAPDEEPAQHRRLVHAGWDLPAAGRSLPPVRAPRKPTTPPLLEHRPFGRRLERLTRKIEPQEPPAWSCKMSHSSSLASLSSKSGGSPARTRDTWRMDLITVDDSPRWGTVRC